MQEGPPAPVFPRYDIHAVGYTNILLINDILCRSIVNYILFDLGDPTTEEIPDKDLRKKLQDVLPL